MLRKIYYFGLGKRIEDVVDTRRTCVNVSEVVMNDADALNLCTHVIRSIDTKWERKRNTNLINPADSNTNNNECVNVSDSDNADPINNRSKNNRSCKSCITLRTRRKKEHGKLDGLFQR